jgi:hypothetical protein
MSMIKKTMLLAGCCAFGLSMTPCANADQVNMQNGERYIGKVVTLTNDTIIVQSDVLGILKVPRNKIASITFGTNTTAGTSATGPNIQTPAAASAQLQNPAAADSTSDLTAAINQLRANPNAMQQVQQQMLAGADPKATEMFNQLMGGLMNGSVNLGDIRAQAKSAADQLRAAKKELGDDAGFALDGYLTVLDNFLRETTSSSPGAGTNAVASPANPKRPQKSEDE